MDKQAVNIKIKLAATVAKGDFHYMHIYNIIVRKCLENLQLALVGRNYYDADQSVSIDQYKLKIWPGFITSIRQHEAGVMMCTEIAHKVMRTETLYDIMQNCYAKNSSTWMNMFKSEILGMVVITHYNNRTYKVSDIDFTTNPLSTFKKRDSSDISYSQYYKEKYKIFIKDLKQPLLVSNSSARDRRAGRSELVYLVPELCYSTGISDTMKNDFHLMKALSDKTKVNPSDRINKLMQFHNRLTSKPEIVSNLNSWNLHLANQLIEIPARVFPQQKILFGNNKIEEARNAEWDLHKNPKQLFKCVPNLADWVVIFPERQQRETKIFIQAVIEIAGRMGFKLERPRMESITDDRLNGYVTIITKLTETSTPRAVVCVVPNNQQQRYNAIKQKLSINKAIPSQVILSRTLSHRSMSTIACKVAIQLNCKLGGTPWAMDISSAVKDLMVVGFDVSHEKSSKNFGAMVSSFDPFFGQYFSAVIEHKSGEELSDCILRNLGRSIGEYRRANNNKLPAHIIIYRDGVGEGQIPFVHDYEVKNIRDKLKSLYAANNLKLKFAFIIVTKRINTRFFDKRNNPRPGTVVDDIVTDPLKYDFFIVSQNVCHGTVAPTAYNVIEDSTGLSPDMVQLITYKLCHLYANYNGTVRVPAPCQYAHKLALFVTQTLKQAAHKDLDRLLYFL